MVTGIGGIFLKANDPKFLARWYEDNLGIGFGNTMYFSFKWSELNNLKLIANTVVSFFNNDTTYFYPATNDVMLNLRVNNLDELRINLKKDGAYVDDKIESYDYGRFGWTMDPAGNKIELWEPVDEGFADNYQKMDLRGEVLSLAGIVIKCPDTTVLMNWYSKHFGIFFGSASHTFEWEEVFTGIPGKTTLSFIPENSVYMIPSEKNLMLSYRVNQLEKLLDVLMTSGIQVSEKIVSLNTGRFGWLVDPEGNKVELWEE